MMTKQNTANQNLMANMKADCEKQNQEICHLRMQLRDALNRLGKNSFVN
jgi:hypothetical protein